MYIIGECIRLLHMSYCVSKFSSLLCLVCGPIILMSVRYNVCVYNICVNISVV